jgi:AcrR family transcriptional regulator
MQGQMDDALPPALARLWGERDRPGRGSLTVGRVVDAAIGLADDEGLAAVSMGRVARALGFTPMSLYRHVAGKDELLALMVDIGAGDPPALPAGGWREQLEAWAWNLRAMMRRHPWVVEVPLSRIQIGPGRLAWTEQAFAALTDTPLAEEDKGATVLLLNGLGLGDVRFARELATLDGPADGSFDEMLAAVVDPARFPAVHRALEAGIFAPDDDPDFDFRFGVARVLDGVDRLIADRNATRGH